MSHYSNYQQAPVVYPPPPTSYPPPEQVYPPPRSPETNPEKVQGYQQGPFVAPPPVGYPMRNDIKHSQQPAETKHRGDGFCRGCCAGLCCFCCLDMCF